MTDPVRGLLDQILDGVVAVDHADRVTYANERAVELSAWSAGPMPGANLWTVFPQGAGTALQRACEAARAGGMAAEAEGYDAGNGCWFEARVHPVGDGLLIFLKDVTEGALSRAADREGERRFRELVESSPATIGITVDEVITYVNPAAVALLGASDASEILGRHALSIIHPDDRALVAGRLKQVGAGQALEPAVQRWIGVDGREVCVESLSQPTTYQGRPAFQTVARDVTDQVRAERAMKEATVLLEMISQGIPVEVVLDELIHMIEAQLPDAMAAVLLADADSDGLRLATGPRLPPGFEEAVARHQAAGPAAWCGAAAVQGEPVIVADVARKGVHAGFRALALAHGIQACWSHPILSHTGEVLGAFTVYHPLPRAPRDADVRMIQSAAHLARIALERTRAQTALTMSERRYRELVELSPDAILIHSDGKLVFANDAARRLFRAERGCLVGRSVTGFVRSASRPGGGKTTRPRRRSKGPGAEYELLRLDGTGFPGEIAAARCEYDGQQATQVVIRDLTERREAESVLQRQALLFAAISDGVMLTDPENRIVDWNPGAERIFGYSRDEVYGRSPAFLHYPEEGAAAVADILAGVERDAVWTGEVTTLRKDGAEVVCDVTVLPLRDEAGRTIARVGINRDVTERRRLEEELMQSQKMEAVGRLAGGVAHDFNNMLTAIKGFASLLEMDLEGQEEAIIYLDEIRKAVDQATSLTRQLLAYGRRQTMQPKVLYLNEVVEDAERMLRRLIPANVVIETQLEADLGCTRVDPHQIERVLMNLVVNARDAMPGGGTVGIATRNCEIEEGQRRQYPTVPPGSYVMLSVRDTGCGMDDRTLAHVFEPFYTTKGPGQGTGLGLATVYGIVQQSGGYVWAASEPGAGSEFIVLLPRAPAPNAGEAPARLLPTAPGGRGTILLVEDEGPVRLLVRLTLQRQGYQVFEARDGEEALRVLREAGGRVDLLLTDVVMPKLGGHSLARQVLEQVADVRVVFMSGYAGTALVEDGTLALGHRFLQKPFEPHALAEAIHDEMGRVHESRAAPVA